MQSKQLCDLVITAMEDLKAVNTLCLDVTALTDLADNMIIATGTSNRHVSSIVDHVAITCKAQGVKPLGIEGQDTAEWVLIDLVDVVVHVMLPASREFYDLERLWGPVEGIQRPDGQV